MNITEQSFTQADGVERKLTEIVQENMDRVSNSYLTGLSTVNDWSENSENFKQAVNQGLIQYDLEVLIDIVKQANFIKSAEGDALDDIGERKGVYREEGSFATGTVNLTLTPTPTSPIRLYNGTEVSTEDSIIFILNEDITFNTGTSTITADVICDEHGTIGNVKAGSINTIITDLPYNLTVTNPSDFTTGADEETDDDYKERIKNSQSPGTSLWFEETAKTLVTDALYNLTSYQHGTLVYKPTDGVVSSDLIALFNLKENSIVNHELTIEEAESSAVIDETMSITIYMRAGFSFETALEQITININNYIDKIPLGGIFNPDCLRFYCEIVEGVGYASLTGFESVDLTNTEYAIINGDLQITEGSS
ncbi:hypothetical protein SDC9_07407 [bioreactor metagenome]|uniref:Baseplate protein J-like barrel domain-containing protein n=1 Tax=bioreactor metagenome TaxID=1076179 RepID=A0A644T4G3_9ZZZZ|nr:baseplate J/gp47 family protein [Methanobrevibacter sp.]MEA4956862.1 baseplate J/gp47 family protein [Methanobrevibacter sp.]